MYRIEGLLVDSGPSNGRKYLRNYSWPKKPEVLLLTHYHEDHSGNAGYLKGKFNLRAFGHPLTSKILDKGFPILPYEKIMFGPADLIHVDLLGDTFDYGHYTFYVIETPGHAPGHVCFFEPKRGWLFAGDMYVAEKIKIWRRTENLAEQIMSLKKLCSLNFDALWCGHNPQPKSGPQLLRKKLEYFEWFYGRVSEAYSKGLSRQEALRYVRLKERILLKLLTFNDVSVSHMISSVYETERRKEDVTKAVL